MAGGGGGAGGESGSTFDALASPYDNLEKLLA